MGACWLGVPTYSPSIRLTPTKVMVFLSLLVGNVLIVTPAHATVVIALTPYERVVRHVVPTRTVYSTCWYWYFYKNRRSIYPTLMKKLFFSLQAHPLMLRVSLRCQVGPRFYSNILGNGNAGIRVRHTTW